MGKVEMRRRAKKALELPNRELEETRITDPEDGKPANRHRVTDTLGRMLTNGTITPEMFDAGQAFQENFILANLDGLRALPLVRQLGTGGPADFTDRQLIARRRALKSIETLGGIGSQAASVMWHVVGLQESLRQWAQRCGWGGRAIRPDVAAGILAASLDILAREEGR
jgi:hypothetical protein